MMPPTHGRARHNGLHLTPGRWGGATNNEESVEIILEVLTLSRRERPAEVLSTKVGGPLGGSPRALAGGRGPPFSHSLVVYQQARAIKA
eukprot:365568-Amorphochlora_amoeboformis.AAC.1